LRRRQARPVAARRRAPVGFARFIVATSGAGAPRSRQLRQRL